MYFFVQSTVGMSSSSPSGFDIFESNKFSVISDDVSMLKLGAEVNIAWTDKLKLNSSVWYYNYQMDELEEPWHKPEFEMEANAIYQFTKELSFQAGVNMIGKRSFRYIKLTNENGPTDIGFASGDLDAVYDLNVGANYQINEHFAAFGQVNNLFADKYYKWEGYPSQGLNFLLGVKISL
jgi:outer membrane receptor for ferrienterochelin and colicin